jgi:hypothetical protein
VEETSNNTNTKRNIIIFILSLLLAIVGYFLIQSKLEKNSILKSFNQQQDSTHYWKDKFGVEHAMSRSITVDKQTAEVVYGKKLDSLSSLLHITKKSIGNVITQTENTDVKVTPQKTDTVFKETANGKVISSLTGSYKDNWVDIKTRLGDSSSFQFHLKDTTTTVLYTKGFFNKENYIDVKHSSPYTKSSDLKSLVIKDANGRLNFSLIAGYGYQVGSTIQRGPIVGVGISYRLFSISK